MTLQFTRSSLLSLVVVFGLFCCASPVKAEWTSPHPLEAELAAPVPLLPFPREVEWDAGGRLADLPATVQAPASRMLETALAELPKGSGKGVLSLSIAESPEGFGAEGYRLQVTPDGVTLEAATEAGLFYGLQTLRQLAAGGAGKIPCCRIADSPAFALRGFMHDCGRNFRSVETLKAEIDAAAKLKMNCFQWHLTDDPGWHIQCKAYPVLNDPAKRTRDPHGTYTYEQIRDVCRYAKERNVTVIPELDMPGHSAYFRRCFGFAMHTEEGMAVLEDLLDEFCTEIPAELCPVIHIGADEVKIPNAQAFVKRMSDKVASHGRTPMQWGGANDLPVGEACIAQRWGEGRRTSNKSMDPAVVRGKTVDSSMGYTNLFDPAMVVRRHFFMRPCGAGKGDAQRLGAIICTWPDIRVDNKADINLQSAHWPGICALAERAWCGGDADGDALPPDLPAEDTEAMQAYRLFELRMDGIRQTDLRGQAFPFRPESDVHWTVIYPVPTENADVVRADILSGCWHECPYRPARGASLYFRTKSSTGGLGMFPDAHPGVTVWAITEITAEEDGPQPFMIGFDAPARSSRRCSGVPANGEWSACGTRIWINGREIRNPKTYRLAGKNRFERDTWNTPANEMPLDNEEVWWADVPTMLPLRKGLNTIVIEQPYVGEFQTWGVNLIPWR